MRKENDRLLSVWESPSLWALKYLPLINLPHRFIHVLFTTSLFTLRLFRIIRKKEMEREKGKEGVREGRRKEKEKIQ